MKPKQTKMQLRFVHNYELRSFDRLFDWSDGLRRFQILQYDLLKLWIRLSQKWSSAQYLVVDRLRDPGKLAAISRWAKPPHIFARRVWTSIWRVVTQTVDGHATNR